MATKEMIKEWFKRGEGNYTHFLIVCDKFDYDHYPVFIEASQSAEKVMAEYNSKSMQEVMEVYNLEMDIEKQLSQRRAFNF